MKHLIKLAFMVILTLCLADFSYAQLDNLIKKLGKTLESGSSLSNQDVVSGLREALQVGTDKAVAAVSRQNGYLNNPRIRIPLPGPIQNLDQALRLAGFGPKVDAFEQSMNRAAEKAAPKAKKIFLEAIGQMTFSDAGRILKGSDNEATMYFKNKTQDRLQVIFKPLIHEAMSKVGVTKQYQDLTDKIGALPFGNVKNLDLDSYVTQKALDGLFFMLAQEEKKIRTDPAARVTPLLKKVFSQT